MNHQSEFENHIRHIAAEMDYPPTPPINIPTRSRRTSERRPPPVRLAWAAVLVVIFLAVSFAVPPIRAALLQIIGLGAVEITVTDSTPSPLNADPVQLVGETTLDAAQDMLDFRLEYPQQWPSPDNVYQQKMPSGAQFNIMVWRDDSGVIDRALYQSSTEDWSVFKQVDELEMTEVDGNTAIWIDAPHLLSFEERPHSPSASNLVEGSVLIWLGDHITYRLEGMPDVNSAIDAAESLRDWSLNNREPVSEPSGD